MPTPSRSTLFTRSTFRHKTALLLLASCLSLTGCGNDDNDKPNANVSGTVAIGSAISGARINAKCADNSRYSTSSNRQGNYFLRIDDRAFPCVIQASGSTLGSTVLHSLIDGPGIVNITSLTDLAMALTVSTATGEQNISDWFDAPETADLHTVATGLISALNTLRDKLDNAGFDLPENWPEDSSAPFNVAFTPNPATDKFDKLLEALGKAIKNASTSYTNLLDTLLSGGDLPDAPKPEQPSSDIPVLAAGEFGVRFASTGTVMGTAETGVVRFIESNGEFEINNNLLKVYVPSSSDSTFMLDLRWLPNTTGSYACGDGLGAGNNQKTIALGYAANNGYSSLGTKGVNGFECELNITHVGSIDGNSYTGYIEGNFRARLFKTGGAVSLTNSVLVEGSFRFGTGLPEEPETPAASCTSGDDKLVFTNSPDDFCGFTKHESANTIDNYYQFTSASDSNGVTYVKITVTNEGTIDYIMIENDAYAFSCGIGEAVCNNATMSIDGNNNKHFFMGDTAFDVVWGTEQAITVSGFLFHIAAGSSPEEPVQVQASASGTVNGTTYTYSTVQWRQYAGTWALQALDGHKGANSPGNWGISFIGETLPGTGVYSCADGIATINFMSPEIEEGITASASSSRGSCTVEILWVSDTSVSGTFSGSLKVVGSEDFVMVDNGTFRIGDEP